MSIKHIRNIKAVYELASAAEIAEGKKWYPIAGETAQVIADRYGITKSTVIAVTAALSPRNRWSRNVQDSEVLISAYVTGGAKQASLVKTCTFSRNRAKAVALLDHEANADEAVRWDDLLVILSGAKMCEFADCISGRDNVCIDGHAWCIHQNERRGLASVPKFTVKAREQIKKDYRKAATDLGLKASELQAITWLAWRRIHGITK